MSTAYDRLRDRVMSGELAPGSVLGEVTLASDLGVSRPTVREALRRLESHGLAASDGRSLRVARMGADELRSAILMRSRLERLHAELAADRVAAGEVAPAQLRRIAALAEDAERATDRGDYTRAVSSNRAFHQAIDALADSPVSERAVDRVWDQILVSTERSLAPPGRRGAVNKEHRDLLAALTAGDRARAGAVAEAHVVATLEATHPGENGHHPAR